ncbi:hypothetical protein BKA67DRAFT_204807 [Truncatella angustata]|uniref:Uncharacterized protein n=1 Tax=Truncatella angustata TaxID=152316 RepID=A0A9P9A174_9PEZI|nr:uncharacterized protein BKA67DRAFT_204807 [Truncatella angustata]KAH6658023.1 hypothetical protein BKA67DRAFT_204807 [Truncatella angustata]
MHLFNILMLASVAAAQTLIDFGPYWWLRPELEQSLDVPAAWIRSAKTTLVIGAIPSPRVDRLAIWPGMATSGGDLIQALAVSFADPDDNCGGNPEEWCTWASTLEVTQKYGTMIPATEGTHITMYYIYNDRTEMYDQTVSVNGQVISTLSTSSGKAQNWQTAVECQESACSSTVPAHRYIDTTIVLDCADETFANSLATYETTSSGFTTSDGGITWTVDTININEYTFKSS